MNGPALSDGGPGRSGAKRCSWSQTLGVGVSCSSHGGAAPQVRAGQETVGVGFCRRCAGFGLHSCAPYPSARSSARYGRSGSTRNSFGRLSGIQPSCSHPERLPRCYVRLSRGGGHIRGATGEGLDGAAMVSSADGPSGGPASSGTRRCLALHRRLARYRFAASDRGRTTATRLWRSAP
jgi:hypothetical protein